MPSGPLGAVVQHLHQLVGGEWTDGQLLERFVGSREEAAFEALVRRHGPMVLRVCRRVLNDGHMAEDAFQATFLVLARRAATIGKRESVGSWLYGAAVRVARKARTSAARRLARETAVAALAHEEGQEAYDDLRPLLDEELHRLSARDRAPLVLCYLEGKTYGQAARELGWSEGSMSRRLAQARERLRQRLLRRGVALSVAGLSAALVQPASAAVPPALLTTTVNAARAFTLEGAGAALPETAAALARAVLRESPLVHLKIAAVVVLALGVTGLSIELTTSGRPSAESPVTVAALPPLPFRVVTPPVDEPPNEENMTDDGAPEEENEAAPIEKTPAAGVAVLPDDEPLSPVPPIKRRDLRSEEELRQLLQRLPELGLDNEPKRATSDRMVQRARKWNQDGPAHVLPEVLAKRPDLAGLNFQLGENCLLERKQAEELRERSLDLRRVIGETLDNCDRRILADALRVNFRHSRVFKESIRQPAAAAPLVQMLPPYDAAVRRLLVERLDDIESPQATAGLVRLALFDLSTDVRAAAVHALAKRPRDQYRRQLLDGLAYPWAPVADHAAEALVALEDREAAPDLKRLLDAPDPAAPFVEAKEKKEMVREVVGINHLRNCLLCHAPSHDFSDAVRAPVPVPGKPLPPMVTYYNGQGDGPFVRADVTYLRQDFSVSQPVEKADPWPTLQRYDYVIRTRPAKAAEKSSRKSPTHPQREAVQFALRELSQP